MTAPCTPASLRQSGGHIVDLIQVSLRNRRDTIC